MLQPSMDPQLLKFSFKEIQKWAKFRVNLKKNQRFSYLDQVSSRHYQLYTEFYINSQTTLTVETVVWNARYK